MSDRRRPRPAPLLAYHFDRTQSVAPTWMSVVYALAMGAGGLASLLLGKPIDRIGLIVYYLRVQIKPTQPPTRA
jgi:hypothetical protein